jgi:hypothetical protein
MTGISHLMEVPDMEEMTQNLLEEYHHDLMVVVVIVVLVVSLVVVVVWVIGTVLEIHYLNEMVVLVVVLLGNLLEGSGD